MREPSFDVYTEALGYTLRWRLLPHQIRPNWNQHPRFSRSRVLRMTSRDDEFILEGDLRSNPNLAYLPSFSGP